MQKNLRVKTSKAIDETYRISFKFNGSTYYGFKGDTLASASFNFMIIHLLQNLM